MSEIEFRSFPKIMHVKKLEMAITQKIHGTNAQIFIKKAFNEWQPAECGYQDYAVFAGSRNRWLSPDDDNFGFSKWVIDNRQELIDKLGEGRHYGEWAGPGINSGEGLDRKVFCLFDWRKFINADLPIRCTTVPVLYQGVLSLDAMQSCMDKLKTNGSYLAPGFMKPEGIVIDIDGKLYKNVFDNEEVSWNRKEKPLFDAKTLDVSYLLQPLRLEKVLSKDEKYLREYPKSLGDICSAYVKDLQEENQFVSQDEDALKEERKALGKCIFYFVKSIVASRAKEIANE